MVKSLYKVGTAVASGAMLLASLGPAALADTTINISGNGAFSNNTANVAQNRTTTVNQTNTANISNNINANAKTGGNSAFANTGGDVSIQTGPASTTTNVSNTVNKNVANVDNCGGCLGDTNVKISGNGAVSENEVNLDVNSETEINQNNDADIENDIEANAKTGGNSIDFTTGGDSSIETGSARSVANVSNTANANVANVGSNGDGGSLDVEISGNGAFSDNAVNGSFSNETFVNQNNEADIFNDVEVNAKTGWNSMFGNTGGENMIETGSALAGANVSNNVNFNWANIEACCFGDVDVKITGNGAGGSGYEGPWGLLGPSGNEVNLDLTNAQLVGQHNDFDCDGEGGFEWPWETSIHDWWNEDGSCADVDANAKTGGNTVDFSTGESEDPAIQTGGASTITNVENNANVNVFGSESDDDFFPFPSDDEDSWELWVMLWHHLVG